MAGSSLETLLRRGPAAAAAGPAADPPDDGADEYPAFAQLRGARQVALMLELRLGDGNSEALDYGWLVRARLDPSAGIELLFTGATVAIRGRRLRPLYEGILRHRVTWVEQLRDPAAVAKDPDATVVTEIAVSSA